MTWTPEKKEEAIKDVLEHVSKGGSVNSIIQKSSRDVIPSWPTWQEWVNEDDDLAKRYARAREDRAELIFEEILQIADDSTNDFTGIDAGNGMILDQKFDYEHVQRSRLRVDARKWMLGKMSPKKFGDKLDVTTQGEKITAPIIGMSIKNESETD